MSLTQLVPCSRAVAGLHEWGVLVDIDLVASIRPASITAMNSASCSLPYVGILALSRSCSHRAWCQGHGWFR